MAANCEERRVGHPRQWHAQSIRDLPRAGEGGHEARAWALGLGFGHQGLSSGLSSGLSVGVGFGLGLGAARTCHMSVKTPSESLGTRKRMAVATLKSASGSAPRCHATRRWVSRRVTVATVYNGSISSNRIQYGTHAPTHSNCIHVVSGGGEQPAHRTQSRAHPRIRAPAHSPLTRMAVCSDSAPAEAKQRNMKTPAREGSGAQAVCVSSGGHVPCRRGRRVRVPRALRSARHAWCTIPKDAPDEGTRVACQLQG